MFDRFLDIVLLCNITKTVAQVFSLKEVFLEISQSSQENICARIYFDKAEDLQLY